jgi:hypothetical protein
MSGFRITSLFDFRMRGLTIHFTVGVPFEGPHKYVNLNLDFWYASEPSGNPVCSTNKVTDLVIRALPSYIQNGAPEKDGLRGITANSKICDFPHSL